MYALFAQRRGDGKHKDACNLDGAELRMSKREHHRLKSDGGEICFPLQIICWCAMDNEWMIGAIITVANDSDDTGD